jgi:hypothetical protein
MKTFNNYCVWSFIHGTIQPSVFKYNQTKEEGDKLVDYFLKNHNSIYYCTKQEYGKYGESLGPLKEDIDKIIIINKTYVK